MCFGSSEDSRLDVEDEPPRPVERNPSAKQEQEEEQWR